MTLRSRFLLWGQKRIEKGAWYFAPLSFLWAFVSFWKNALYDWKFRSVSSVPCPVISVGNLVAGGTGKTPLVLLLASQFPHRKVAILSRGYGEVPDEPLLLQNRIKNAKVYVGKDRVSLAKRAFSEGAEIIFLDDGFQYRKLHRDLDLVLLAGSDPFGKGHYLPWGFLRDSPSRLKSADMIFVSGAQKNVFASPHVQLRVKVDRILDMEQRMVPSIRDRDVAIFCGIAKPHLFEETVRGLGANVVQKWFLADHEKPSQSDLYAFALSAQKGGAKAIVCTEKDAVKLEGCRQNILPLYYVEISFQVAEGNCLWENLIAKIEQKIDNFKQYG